MQIFVAAAIVALAIAYVSAPLRMVSELKAIRKLLEEQAKKTTTR